MLCCNPALGELRQKVQEFEASLVNTAGPCLKKKKKTKSTEYGNDTLGNILNIDAPSTRCFSISALSFSVNLFFFFFIRLLFVFTFKRAFACCWAWLIYRFACVHIYFMICLLNMLFSCVRNLLGKWIIKFTCKTSCHGWPFILVIIYIYLYLFQPSNKIKIKLDVVTHAYNFGYSGGRGRKIEASLRPARNT